MSGRYSAHPDYQDSGLDWLGRIPKSWELRRLGSYFRERRTKVSDAEFSALSVTMQGIVPQLETAAKTNDGDNRKLVRAGDFVINSRSDRKGSSGVSPYDGSVSLISIVLKPLGIRPPFAHHLLRSSAFQEEFYRFGKGIVADLWSTNYAAMKNIVIPVMPSEEQTQIAKFLDYETAKIDALIDKQQQLIALLKEKRQAVISHAVTKGLNPDAPMRDSGVEWLGEVPAHWEVNRLIYVTQGGNNVQMGPFGGMLKGHATEPTKYKLFGQENTISDDFQRGSRWLEEAHFRRLCEYELLPGDVVLTRKGASIGNCRIVPEGVPSGVIDSDTIRVRFDEARINKRLVTLLMHDGYLEIEILAKQKGAVLPGLNTKTISNLLIALPPMDEQLEIVEHLTAHLGRFGLLTNLAADVVHLLQERRTALISAAVTGKIDVRTWKAPESEMEAAVA